MIPSLKIIFAGTPEFAVPTLSVLCKKNITLYRFIVSLIDLKAEVKSFHKALSN